MKLFDQTIVPILLYGSEVAGFENLQHIEKFQPDFLRSILKTKSSTPLVMVYGEFGRFPIAIQIKIRMIKFWGEKLAKTTRYHTKCTYFCYIYIITIFTHVDGFCL